MANEYDYTPEELELISDIYSKHARKCADYKSGFCVAFGGYCQYNCPHFENIAEIVERELSKDY